jgi:hypothetical protein
MADYSITAASVAEGTGARVVNTKFAGEAIAQGEVVYLKSSDGLLWRADNNVTTAEAAAVGIATSAVAAGQRCPYQYEGEITIGATLVAADDIILSANPGKICPYADLATGRYLTRIGYAKTAAIMVVDLLATGIAKG